MEEKVRRHQGSKALNGAPKRMRLPFTVKRDHCGRSRFWREDQKPGFPVNFGMFIWHPSENAKEEAAECSSWSWSSRKRWVQRDLTSGIQNQGLPETLGP